jgi:F420-dependent oxidoreductase-like protein
MEGDAVIRFGLHFSSMSYSGAANGSEVYARIVEAALAAEDNGFDSLWVPDHMSQNAVGGGPRMPLLESVALLGALAARTRRARLGMLVAGVTYRNPALLAKSLTAIDAISGGRAMLGIGAAWDAEEHQRYGFDFPPIAERMDRLEEALHVLTRMLREEAPSYTGRYYQLREGYNAPRPMNPAMPLLVGGGGERRTLRIAAALADATNFAGDIPTLRRKFEVLAAHCRDLGRDPASVIKTTHLPLEGGAQRVVDAVGERFEAGCDGVIFLGRIPHEPDVVADTGAALARAFGGAASASPSR